MPSILRYKYGLFLHPDLADLEGVALRYTDELVESFRDPIAPALGSVEVRWQVAIVRLDDSVVFSVRHTPSTRELIVDDVAGPIRAGLLEALDWWNGETVLLAPESRQLVWDGPALPNAWTNPWQAGVVVQNITQYPARLGKRVLEEWNPGLRFLPFELVYTPPTPEQEEAAVKAWQKSQAEELRAELARWRGADGGPWFLARAQRYRKALVPLPSGLQPVGMAEQAERAATEYRGLCFLVNAETGETLSRWAERRGER